MENYHLVPDGNRWILTKEGSERSVGSFDSKAQALESSTALLGDRKGSLKIHKLDGAIEEERTYPRAADPARSPG